MPGRVEPRSMAARLGDWFTWAGLALVYVMLLPTLILIYRATHL